MSIDIAALRKDYSKKELKAKDCLENPIEQFNKWFKEALDSEVLEANAMTVASVDANGRPSSRTVLIKGVENGSFVFYTNYNSRKGQQLQEQPFASLTFYWRELERQVQIEGKVVKVSEETSDRYFESRPYKSKVGAWASEQSQVISSKNVVTKRFVEHTMKFLNKVPRPPHWGGFAVIPDRIEFWQGRPSRLHDRIVYTMDENGNWKKERLAP
ncbi:MAG: pyridoxamine 5'-phosphate oxidase [Cytophagales bacterium]|nr:pyridoxamine 5'-phosphate oxidase [Cytophagales bacterium]